MNFKYVLVGMIAGQYATAKSLRGDEFGFTYEYEPGNSTAIVNSTDASLAVDTTFNESVELDEAVELRPQTTAKKRRKPATLVIKSEQNRVVNLWNNARSKVLATNMRKINGWSDLCSQAILDIAYENGAAWFFQRTLTSDEYNAKHLDLYPPFNQACPGWHSLERDTNGSKKNPISKIFQFRERRQQQNKCCDIEAKCDLHSFNNFKSCCNVSSGPSKRCSSSFYYPRHYIASLQEFAGVVLKIRGPHAPKKRKNQPYTYLLYAKYSPPQNDMPYTLGAPCSECPSEAPQCLKNLCTT